MPQAQPPPMNFPNFPQLGDNADDLSNFDFSAPLAVDSAFPGASGFDNGNFNFDLNNSQPQNFANTQVANPSTELVRRARNQPLVNPNMPPDRWNGLGNMTGQVSVADDEEDLKTRIARAKKDAQGKRKQIPPFVQKLWSFLESNNTDLIRWSDDGRSFIVLDEDEFARTMIPELFKHNNYASFVRQLNMYGFHKTVNITDGSLRQSEKARKGVKPPSMYSHEFFQRNQPELLWLIQKPGGKTTSKRKREGGKNEFDSDDERQMSPVPEGRSHELAPPGSSQDLAHLPRNELVAVRHELQKLQHQQKFISQMITQLKEQNDQFYRQATAFQALHDRHENSINAILTFLASFYNRSMDGHGPPNLVNMFANATQNQQQHGSVVEEYNDPADNANHQQIQRYQKKPPLLLTGPPASNQRLQPGSAATQPNSARASVTLDMDASQRAGSSSIPPDTSRAQTVRNTASPVIKDDAPTPDALNQVPESNDQMLNLIQNATQASTPSNSTPAFDFNSLLGDAAAGPLTPQQRDNMVRSFANMQGGEGSNNNALVGTGNDLNNFASQLKQSNDALEKLTTLQKQQDERVQELNRRLQPLSPTGAIPGLDVSNIDPFDSLGAPGDYDPNAFFDFDENNWENAGGGEGNDNGEFDFKFDPAATDNGGADWNFGDDMFGSPNGGDRSGTADLQPHQQELAQDGLGRIESVSSSTATSPTTAPGEEPGTPRKRLRRT